MSQSEDSETVKITAKPKFFSSKLSIGDFPCEEDQTSVKDVPKKPLRDLVKELKAKNEESSLKLAEKDAKIVNMQTTIDNLNDIINSGHEEMGVGSSFASSKIIKLCKKNRSLRSELEVYKTKSGSLEKKIEKLKETVKEEKQKAQKLSSEIVPPSENEIDALNEKLASAKTKNFEVMNENIKLKTELKLAMRCLQQEIGQNVTIAKLVNDKMGWRGRAQKIIALQDQLNDLKARYVDNIRPDRTEEFLQKINLLKKNNDELKTYIDNLSRDILSMRQFTEDQKSRISYLNNKIVDQKTKIQDLTVKSEHQEAEIAHLELSKEKSAQEYEAKISDLVTKMQAIEDEYNGAKTKAMLNMGKIFKAHSN